MGHSTGYPKIVCSLASEPKRSLIQKAILQAPVSDREALASYPSFPPTFAALAADLYAAGQRDELVPGGKEAFAVDVTVYRAWSLACEGGDDDYFSLLSPLPLHTTFGKLPLSTPTLFLFSSKDEHTPNASTAQHALRKAWEAAVPKELKFRGSMLEGSHELKKGREGWEELARWETS